MISRLKGQHGSGIREANIYLGQEYIVADSSLIPELLQVLRDQEKFDYCVDITAVHYPDREKQFEVVWILYSFPHNERIRVKASYAETESVPSAVPIWPAVIESRLPPSGLRRPDAPRHNRLLQTQRSM